MGISDIESNLYNSPRCNRVLFKFIHHLNLIFPYVSPIFEFFNISSRVCVRIYSSPAILCWSVFLKISYFFKLKVDNMFR